MASHRMNWIWILVLVLTAGFQFYRGAAFDGVVFSVAAGLLILAELRILRVSVRTRLPRRTAMAVSAVVAALFLVVFALHTALTGVVLVAIGLLALPYAWAEADSSGSEHADQRVLHRTAVAWGSVAVAACVWRLLACQFVSPIEVILVAATILSLHRAASGRTFGPYGLRRTPRRWPTWLLHHSPSRVSSSDFRRHPPWSWDR